jgi:hypothetical protein
LDELLGSAARALVEVAGIPRLNRRKMPTAR